MKRTLKRQLLLACCSVILTVKASSVSAQVMINSGPLLQPTLEIAKPVPDNLPFFPTLPVTQPTTIYGDPGHVRHWLAEKGIVVAADYRAIANSNVSGGTQQASAIASQVGLEFDVDWGRLAGIEGLSSYLATVNRFGQNSSISSGNALVRAENFLVASSGGSDFHFAYGYLQERFAHGKASIAVGRFPVAMTFGSSPLNCNFVGNALCGNVKALTGKDVSFSVYPNSSWAARFTVYPLRNLYVQSGIFAIDQAADTGPAFNRTGWNWSTSNITGFSVPIEVGYIPLFGPHDLIGHYKLGFALARAPYTTFGSAMSKSPPATIHQKSKFWIMADQMITRHGKGVDEGLIATIAYVHNQRRVSTYGEQIVVSLIDRGFWKQRPSDAIGIMASTLKVSPDLTVLQEYQYASGLKLSGGAASPQSRESNFEIFYDALIARGFRVEPDLQFIMNPNGERKIKNEITLGIMVKISI